MTKPVPIATAERRVERWLKLDPAIYGAIAGDGTYRAMVYRLVDAMNAVGPADAMTGLTALVKTTALIMASMLRLEDDDKVEELCKSHGAWVANEVMALRKAIAPENRNN